MCQPSAAAKVENNEQVLPANMKNKLDSEYLEKCMPREPTDSEQYLPCFVGL